MHTLRRAIGNSSIMLVSQMATWIASLALTASMGRHLGDEGFGQLYLAMSFTAIFGILVEFGLDRQMVRAVARDRSRISGYLVNSLAIKGAMFVVSYLLIVGLTAALGYAPEVARVILVYNVILLFGAVSTSYGTVYLAAERMFHTSVASVLEKIVIAAAGVTLLSLGYGVLAVAVVSIGGTIVGIAWKACFLRRWLRIAWRLDPGLLRELLRGALPFFLYAALGSVYFRIDVVLLSALTDTAVVGWYGAAYRLFDTLVFLPNIIASAVMLPILSRLSVQSREQLRLALGKGLDVMLILGVPISTGLYLLARPIIGLIYARPEFLNAVPALRWLAVALLLLYVNTVLGTLLISIDREKQIVGVSTAAIIINLGLNWLLIPHYQHVAAAAATTLTEIFLLAYMLALVPRDLFSRASLLVLGKTVLAAALMGLTLQGLRAQALPLQIAAGGVVFCLGGLLLQIIPGKDLRLLREAIALRHAPASPEPDAMQA